MQDNKKILTETNFIENLKSPMKRLVLIYPLFIVALVLIGRYYVQHQDNTSDNKAIYKQILNKEKQDEDIQAKPAMMTAGVDVKLFSKSTDELVAKGATLYASNCASCHGDNGDGNGVAGANLNPKPRNFHSLDGWTNGPKINQMYKTLEEGIIKNGMNSFAQLPVDERFALIYYIRSLTPGYPEVTEDEMSELDLTYSLSEGRKTNNQIPISKAMTVITKEHSDETANVKSLLNKINNDKQAVGYNVYHNVISDGSRFLNVLQRSNAWKESPANFFKMINSNLVENGVKVEFSRLNTNQINDLYVFMKSMM